MNYIGKGFNRVDGLIKANGTHKYPSDYKFNDMLILGVKRSEIPHGEILSIHKEKALEVPGIKAIFTYEDVPGTNRHGIVYKDQEVLCEKKVRHIGDPICLVAGDSKESVSQALKLIRINYKEIPVVTNVFEALDKKALVHEKGNLLHKIELFKGDIQKGFEESDIIVENTYTVPFQDHMPLETEAGVGYLDEDGKIAIIAGTQTIYRDIDEISYALDIPKENIRVSAPFFGGGFGRKDGITIQILLALAVLKLKKPVKIYLERSESINSSYHRHAAIMKYKTGALRDGTINAVEAKLYFDKGAYASLGAEVLNLAVEHFAGPYNIENTHVTGFAVYTNNPTGGAFRGFGVPQVTFAVESQMDIIARTLNIDPIEIRKNNVIKQWDKSAIGHTFIYSTGLYQCLEKLENSQIYKNRSEILKSDNPYKKRGMGLAVSYQGGGLGVNINDSAEAKITLNLDGTLTVFGGISDMGQGNTTTYVQIACELLNIPKEKVYYTTPDSKYTLDSGPASASRTTYIYGKALEGAIRVLKDTIIKKAALLLGADENDITLENGQCYGKKGEKISFSEVAKRIHEHERTARCYADCPLSRDGHEIGHGLPHIIYSHAAHLAVVEVDTLTGAVKIIDYLTATECGKVLNPVLLEGQVHGGVAQGIGYGLYEGLSLKDGKILNNKMSTYIIPSIMDVPNIDCLHVEPYETTGAFGMKGAGELSIDAPAPTLSNAIYDAVAYRSYSLPITAEKILLRV